MKIRFLNLGAGRAPIYNLGALITIPRLGDLMQGVKFLFFPIFSYFSDPLLFIPIFPEKLLFFLFFQNS